MSSIENREAINLLAQQIVQMMKQGQDANNKGFVSRQIKNATLNAGNIRGLNQIVAEQVGKTEIIATQIKGLETEIQDAVNEEMSNVTITVGQIQDLSAEVARIAAAEIKSAVIDTAQIKDLSAEVANIVVATIGEADIDWADITNLTAAIASISLAEIKDARIGFAQIDGLVAGQALITEAVGGKVMIQDLSVTDANIVDLNANKITAGTLEVERLVIVGSEKSIVYAINEANGTTQLSQSTIDGGSITRKTITADQIIANGITAECLNVSEIFANEALIGAITAQNIDTASLAASEAFISTLFTQEAFITNLNTADISNNESLKLVVDELRKEFEAASVSSLGQQLILTFERGRAFENGDEVLTVRAKIFKEGIEVTSDVSASAFKWERLSGDAEADSVWAADEAHQNKKELQLTKEDIGKSCTIRCTYTINAEDGTVLQAETNVFDHTILQTSHILIKDDLIDISSGGKINMAAGSDINIKAGGKISLEPGSSLEVSLEDVKTSEDETLGDTVDTIEQKITPEAMVTNVSSYVQNAKEEAIRTSSTELTATSEAIVAEFNTAVGGLQSEVDAVAKEQAELSVYIRASGDGLEIGKEGDPAKFRADNRTLEVTNIKTERIGIAQKMSENEEWAWIAAQDGLSLKWIGGEV